MKIWVGEYEVLSSGMLIALKNQPVVFQLNDQTVQLMVRFFFEDTEYAGEPQINIRSCGTDRLDIVFRNFTDMLGDGPSEAWELGGINHRKLYLACRVSSINENRDKIVYYTWYLGERLPEKD
ncbi:DUF6864 domain-containing function [Pelotomaculum propionicicum]|uniref:DUF6864 domain-containing function n=1 Tax=Pelotomaculum propionicicum TaxID=258475 RepID=UPI003B81ED8E